MFFFRQQEMRQSNQQSINNKNYKSTTMFQQVKSSNKATTYHGVIYSVACTEMTKTKKNKNSTAVHVVELSWASVVIIFKFKS